MSLPIMQALPWDAYTAWWGSRSGPSLELVQYGIPTCRPCVVLKDAISALDWSAVPVCLQGHIWAVDLQTRPDDDTATARPGDPVNTVDCYPTLMLLSHGHPNHDVRVEATWVRPSLPTDWPAIVRAAHDAQYALQSEAVDAAFAV